MVATWTRASHTALRIRCITDIGLVRHLHVFDEGAPVRAAERELLSLGGAAALPFRDPGGEKSVYTDEVFDAKDTTTAIKRCPSYANVIEW